MMQRRGFLVALAALAGSMACPPPSHAEPLKQVTLRVDGMTWPWTWPPRVMRALVGLPGIKDVQVSFEKASATVTYEPRQTTVVQMIAAINKAGFRARLLSGK